MAANRLSGPPWTALLGPGCTACRALRLLGNTSPLVAAGRGLPPSSAAVAPPRPPLTNALVPIVLPCSTSMANMAEEVATRVGSWTSAVECLAAGADPNAVCPDTGHTALMLAVARADMDCVEVLLSGGADPQVGEGSMGGADWALHKVGQPGMQSPGFRNARSWHRAGGGCH